MTSTTSGQINVNAPAYVKNKRLIEWVGEVAALTKPDAIRWCDGSQAEYDELCELLVSAGVFKRLNPAKRKNSFLASTGNLLISIFFPSNCIFQNEFNTIKYSKSTVYVCI